MLVKGAIEDSRYGNQYILYIEMIVDIYVNDVAVTYEMGRKRYMNWIILTVQLQIKLGGCRLLEGVDILHVNS